jgi:hypothetical protein
MWKKNSTCKLCPLKSKYDLKFWVDSTLGHERNGMQIDEGNIKNLFMNVLLKKN